MEGRSPATPVSPYTLANERFKTNLNRNKTRKWVEAKKIDYGGDDWGAEDEGDEDEDEEEEEEEEEEAQQGGGGGGGGYGAGDSGSPTEANPPMALAQHPTRPGRLAGLRSIGQQDSGNSTSRSGSGGSARSLRPSERVAMERQGSSSGGALGGQTQGHRIVTGPPSLHIHTGVQSQRPVQQVESALSTSTSPYSANVAQPHYPPRKSSMASRERPNLTVDSSMHPPRTSSRSVSPASGSLAAPPAPPKMPRPSEVEKSEEQQAKEGDYEHEPNVSTVQSSLVQTGGGVKGNGEEGTDGSQRSQPLAAVAERKSEYDLDRAVSQQPDAPSQPTMSSAPAEPVQSSLLPALSQPSTMDETVPQEPRKRFSTSPKLPDLNRLSGFGSDFFSSGGGFMSDTTSSRPQQLPPSAAAAAAAAPSAVQEEQQEIQEPRQPRPFRPSIPGGWVSETTSIPSEMPTPFREQENKSIGSGLALHAGQDRSTSSGNNSERTEDASLKPAPLRTPTPRSVSPTKSDAGSRGGPSRSSHHASAAPASAMLPPPSSLQNTSSPLANVEDPTKTTGNTDEGHTPDDDGAEIRNSSEAAAAVVSTAPDDAPAPLQPRRRPSTEQISAAVERPHPMSRVDTMASTADSSPLKESDVLRDEIMRSLSPVRSSHSNLNTFQDESAARESAYLNDVYGDYWTAAADDTTKDEHDHNGNNPPEEQAKVLGRLGVNADKDKVEPIPSTTSESAMPPLAANEPEAPPRPDVARDRFSWEAAGEEGGDPSPPLPTVNPHHPLPELPKEEEPTGSPSAAPPQLSPVDSGGPMSPLISLPVLNFGRDGDHKDHDEHDHDGGKEVVENGPSRDEQRPPYQVTSDSDVPQSPVSPSGKEVLTAEPTNNRGSMFFSGSEEKITVISPTSPWSPTSDVENAAVHQQPRHADSLTSETTPNDIPLPRSPSPAREGGSGDDAHQPSSSPQQQQQQQQQQHIASLRQIMSLPTSPERVYKMLEARSDLASTPSGLMDWLAQILATPEHAHGGPSFQYAPAGDDVAILANSRPRPSGAPGVGGAGSTAAGGGAADAGTGQQHAHGGPVHLGSSGGGSVRIPGASAAQLQLGHLMHGQAGTKGKELLQSAGKMGKGLLSKGKNKLRERKG
ncbi:hypothetical protein M406DRAFT_353936 [Cryphonectria parasitica EP155]|uniref:Uncharacterized protein n=1 Tax=Cryphonectria parasitica (strain ATCC 38755 / EP155) TaxID=660469 RepID=A0A9P5CJ64_CRYP1|nr:uncharacterized protein M406DRAFT_353936 [Cryphonectria parasitica EP155]KAF3759947.1 hypothetical protein M406DRAFT_353936 [Cryphonectria parasitica EP155]